MFEKQSIHRVNGVDLNILDVGEGDPALVFLHFWGGSSRTWTPIIEDLSTTNRCIAMDFRGWGESSKQATDYRLETLASDVIGVLEELALKEFIVIGHSMGGKVAQLVAAEQPVGLTRLILLAPAPPTALETSEAERQGMIASYSSPKGAEKAIGILSSAQNSEAARKRVQPFHQQMIEDILCGSTGAKLAWPMQGMIEDIREKTSRISVPVRVIVGSADSIERESSLRIAFGEVLPGTKFTVLPGVGHMSPLEATAEVIRAVRTVQTS